MNEFSPYLSKIADYLLDKGWTITTAESCTGGGISSEITSMSGSSAYFDRAFVTYSNNSKSELVGVPPQLLEKYGAVSSQVVEKMAVGSLQRAKANVSIAVSGIAGPNGGTKDKPVGTVWIAIAIQTDIKDNPQVFSERFMFDGDRENIRRQTIKSSFIKVLELIG